jgi:hypothetical protein
MNRSLSRSTIVRSAALALVASATVHAQVVDIDGGNSWSGWNSVGNSQTSGTWVKGSTNRTYDIYSTYFVLSAGQVVSGTRIANGAAGNGVGYTGDLLLPSRRWRRQHRRGFEFRRKRRLLQP